MSKKPYYDPVDVAFSAVAEALGMPMPPPRPVPHPVEKAFKAIEEALGEGSPSQKPETENHPKLGLYIL